MIGFLYNIGCLALIDNKVGCYTFDVKLCASSFSMVTHGSFLLGPVHLPDACMLH
jgi:hypothetical protein